MATCAIRSQFGFVHIGVARRAKTACTCVLQSLVTAHAFDSRVLPFQSKPRFSMLECGVSPHLPRIGRMTRLTCPLYGAVRRRLPKRTLRYSTDHQYEDQPLQQSLHSFMTRGALGGLD